MWYVIQTMTGNEKELVEVIDKMLNGKGYDKCFVIQRECAWRIEGRYRIHVEPMFPSYIFVETSTPEEFFFQLKQVPKLTKLLGGDGMFLALQKEEVELLEKMIGNDEEFIVRRSLVQIDEDGNIISAEGILKEFIGRIVRKRLRKRECVIEIPFLGELRRVLVGVKVEGERVLELARQEAVLEKRIG